MAALSPREDIFVRAYCVRYNGTRAAIAAGYAQKSARQAASSLLTKPNIQAAIQRHLKARKARFDQTADNLRKEVAYVAMARPGDFYDELGDLLHPQDLPEHAAAALASFEQGLTSNPRGRKGQQRTREPVIKVKLHDKVEAQALLARLLGLDKGEDLTVPSGPVFILPPGSEVNIE